MTWKTPTLDELHAWLSDERLHLRKTTRDFREPDCVDVGLCLWKNGSWAMAVGGGKAGDARAVDEINAQMTDYELGCVASRLLDAAECAAAEVEERWENTHGVGYI